MHPTPPPFESAWGTADLISVAVAVVFTLIGLLRYRRHPNRPPLRDFVGNGLAMGPLLMIVGDPLNKFFGLDRFFGAAPFDLLRLVLTEARVTLWWAAIVAITDVVDILTPKPVETAAPARPVDPNAHA